MKAPAVYILASQRNGTLYIGVTSDLIQRIWQHREGVVDGFTQQHSVKTLVWYEQHDTMESAITREKALKKWNRDWKLRLIEERNLEWHDLWFEITGQEQTMPNDRHSSNDQKDLPLSNNSKDRHSREGGNPVPHLVQSTTNMDGATRYERTGFPPKTCGNDGNTGGGL